MIEDQVSIPDVDDVWAAEAWAADAWAAEAWAAEAWGADASEASAGMRTMFCAVLSPS